MEGRESGGTRKTGRIGELHWPIDDPYGDVRLHEAAER